jgi:hypothetical protein
MGGGKWIMAIVASTSATGSKESLLKKEWQILGELFARLRDAILNRIFDLRPEKAIRRMWYLIILLFASGFLISLYFYPFDLWGTRIQTIFRFLFDPNFAAAYDGNPFLEIILFTYQVFTDPRILQYLPVFLAPFFIALQSAAIYLADVFELEDISVARQFIWEVALLGSNRTIRISQGDIADEHRGSSIHLIGGPGKVVVDFDSVVLFEKPDGTPHIIAPTTKETGGKATLGGFERFRQAFDLRDHFIELRDISGNSAEVKGRSLDGIPISATDVRFVFSILGEDTTTDNNPLPYSFNKDVIHPLVYKATSKVTPDQKNPSAFDAIWINNITSLIRATLGSFMSKKNLTDYLASIGAPEHNKALQREEEITQHTQRWITLPDDEPPIPRVIPPLPDFTPRYKITNLFYDFADEFTKSANNRGVRLRWIGVGTWKTPIEKIFDQHLEAWQTSLANAIKLKKRKSQVLETRIQEYSQLLQEIAYSFSELRSKELENTEITKYMLRTYKSQIKLALDIYTRRNIFPPAVLREALRILNRLLAYYV